MARDLGEKTMINAYFLGKNHLPQRQVGGGSTNPAEGREYLLANFGIFA